MKIQKLTRLAIIIGLLGMASLPFVSHAFQTAPDETPVTSTPFSVASIGGQIGVTNTDLRDTIMNALKIALGLLALVAVIMVIIGGFTWLTAAGNEEKVDKAKKIISAAVIGLIIVLLAWAIVLFVIKTTVQSTNTTA